MLGRLDDHLQRVMAREGIVIDPAHVGRAGIAVFKRAYGEWRAHGYRARLLGAAIRHHLHWSELIGGDVIITMPSAWQKRFNASSIEVRPRIDEPVPAEHLDALRGLPDFMRAFEPDGLAEADFDTWAPTVRTLRAFIGSYHELLHLVTDAALPNPDS